MKGDKNYKKASEILDMLYNKEAGLCDNKAEMYSRYIDLIRLSAYSGNYKAQLELALHYEEYNFFGLNKKYNKKRTIYWYEKSCAGNISDACNNLAIAYSSEGRNEEAVMFYKKAMRLGNTLAKKNLRRLI